METSSAPLASTRGAIEDQANAKHDSRWHAEGLYGETPEVGHQEIGEWWHISKVGRDEIKRTPSLR